jgi:hypothetical protein
MKSFATSILMFVIGIAGAQAASSVCSSVTCVLHGVPAPSIGAGVPVALAIGGVLLGTRFLKSRRRL